MYPGGYKGALVDNSTGIKDGSGTKTGTKQKDGSKGMRSLKSAGQKRKEEYPRPGPGCCTV